LADALDGPLGRYAENQQTTLIGLAAAFDRVPWLERIEGHRITIDRSLPEAQWPG
jgi:hypothetical protein